MAYAIKIKVRYRDSLRSNVISLPGIFTQSGLLISHLRYLSNKFRRSESWREKAVHSVVLLLKFIAANESRFVRTVDMLSAFSYALIEGTIDFETYEDPSGLFWSPRRIDDARSILSHVTKYTDWLAEQPLHDSIRANPFRKADSDECKLNWCAYYNRRSQVFLNHLISNGDGISNSFIREVRVPSSPVLLQEEVKRFAEESIDSLLKDGFVLAGVSPDAPSYMRMDYKSQAVTLLQHYGGLRKCECFHLYKCDIAFNKKLDCAVVYVFHPSDGKSPDERYRTRREYLAREFNLRPRTEYPKSERLHLGWKAPLLTDRRGCFRVIFFPAQKAKEFLLAWANYIKYQRVPPPPGEEHPYAFTNCHGHPETVKNYQRLHSLAVKRIGLTPKKSYGTTEHGHRHSYGYRLGIHGFDAVYIQKAMHHKSPKSALVYTQPSDEDVFRIMREIE
ncbi:gamma-mobile-trio recombinase GmtY [Pseudomonas panipatensis]|uniref:gamma-mobile-trio recombinase GmtY n=1 Tax=Pseudomonas panipatensis TaxID=428992 RepID=UPI0035B4F3F6